jgi:uncharacterized membrane protein required for colicin V production
MIDRAYFNPTFLQSLTWVDLAIVAIPAICVLAGLLRGGTSLMHFGLIRFMTAWPLATAPALYINYYQRQLIDQVQLLLGITPVMATAIVGTVVFVIALIIIYRVLGLIWRGLRHVLASSLVGDIIDRLLGIPAGLFAGGILTLLLAIVPGVQLRSSLPQVDQTPALRNSVLLAMAEEQMRGLARYVPPPR